MAGRTNEEVKHVGDIGRITDAIGKEQRSLLICSAIASKE